MAREIDKRSTCRTGCLAGAVVQYRHAAMSGGGNSFFDQGQPVWVMEDGGSQRAAKYLGESETTAWFGGKVTVMVVYDDTHAPATVDADRVIPRDG